MAQRGLAHIEIEGYKEFQRDLKRATGKMPKALGEAHKKTGALIISKLSPAPMPESVGEGFGAAVRPSATKRDLVILAGHGGRVRSPLDQWGKKVVQPFKGAPPRPYIVQTALDHEGEIREYLMNELMDVLAGAFYEAT
jgi:hypothetical protein